MKPVPLWRNSRLRGLLAAGAGLSVAACGGAGGGGVPPVSSTPATVTPAPTPTPTPAVNYDTAEYRRSGAAAGSGAITAWQAGATGQGATIAFIDSGIDTMSSEFSGRIAAASRDVSGQGRGLTDVSGHGTAVAGVAAAARNDAQIMGVAFGATIASFRADNGDCSDGCRYTDSAIAAGVDAALNAGARAINISLGGSSANAPLRAAFVRATNQGAVLVISAGNDALANPDPLALGALSAAGGSAVIIVGSVGGSGTISDFSNRAGTAANNFLVALGEDVRSFDQTGQPWLYSGTSFATPAVTGAVALLAQAFPNLTGARITEILLTTADDLGDPGTDAVYGRGRLNIGRAMAPIGQTSLAGTAIPVSATSSGALGSAFGSGLATAAGLANVPVTDSYDRLYSFALNSRFRTAAPGRLAARIESAGLESTDTDFSAGPFEATLALRATRFRDRPGTDPFRDEDLASAHLGFAQRGMDRHAAARNPLRETRLSLRRDDIGLSLASGRLAQEALPGSAAPGFAADDGLTPDDAMGTRGRLLVMADWRHRDLTFAVAASNRRLMLPRLDGLAADNRQSQLLVAANWARGPLALTLHAADTREQGAFLGTRLSPTFGLLGGHTRSLAAAMDLGREGWGVRLAGTQGWATPAFGSISLLRGAGSLSVQNWSVTGHAPLADGRLTLTLAQPVAITAGQLRLADGTPLAAAVTARETAAELGWTRGALQLAAFHRRNAGNLPGLADTGAAISWRAGF